jgi:hypothetical protein
MNAYICHRPGAHRHYRRGAERLSDTQKCQRAKVRWQGGQEDVRCYVEEDGDDVERPPALPVCQAGPEEWLGEVSIGLPSATRGPLTATANTTMNADTVALIAVAPTPKTRFSTGSAGRYMLPARGPRKPARVTRPRMYALRPGENAVYVVGSRACSVCGA